jgi:hypothetical protein
MAAVIALIVFGVFLWWFLRRTVPPPDVQTLDELQSEGHTLKQAKAEQRRQRAELRAHANTQAHATRAATQAGRFALKVGKQLLK